MVEHGAAELFRRLSDPIWFQAFGAVMGMDWHSSGVTTTVCGALKQGLRGRERELGLVVAGGKGRTSRQTPNELTAAGMWMGLDPAPYVQASRMAAKVDNNALQDGYQIYHHVFLLDTAGNWAVVQPGMHDQRLRAALPLVQRRCPKLRQRPALGDRQRGHRHGLEPGGRRRRRRARCDGGVAREQPEKVVAEVAKIRELTLPAHHDVKGADVDPRRLHRILLKTYQRQPRISLRCWVWRVSARGRCGRLAWLANWFTARQSVLRIRRALRSRTAARTATPTRLIRKPMTRVSRRCTPLSQKPRSASASRSRR